MIPWRSQNYFQWHEAPGAVFPFFLFLLLHQNSVDIIVCCLPFDDFVCVSIQLRSVVFFCFIFVFTCTDKVLLFCSCPRTSAEITALSWNCSWKRKCFGASLVLRAAGIHQSWAYSTIFRLFWHFTNSVHQQICSLVFPTGIACGNEKWSTQILITNQANFNRDRPSNTVSETQQKQN